MGIVILRHKHCFVFALLTKAPQAPLGDDACGAQAGARQVEGVGPQLERGEGAGHPQLRVLVPAQGGRELGQPVVERPAPRLGLGLALTPLLPLPLPLPLLLPLPLYPCPYPYPYS